MTSSYISTQTRRAYGDRLQQSLDEGYLSIAEYADRLRVIWGADTREQLDYVFRDLPEPVADGEVTVRIDHVRRKFRLRTFTFSPWWPLFWLVFNSAYLSWSAVTGKTTLTVIYSVATAFWLVMTAWVVSPRLPRKIRY